MIDTNALLAIGLSIVTNFSDVVQVPNGAVPRTTQDLAKFVVGGPPPVPSTDLYLVDRRGTQFRLRNGTVHSYSSPMSYKEHGASREKGRSNDVPLLNSNQVVERATEIIRRLAKSSDPTVGLTPLVRRAGDVEEKIPFYWISWTNVSRIHPWSRRSYSAFVEIDARSGCTTHLDLEDPGFYDAALAQQISNRVCTPERETTGPTPWELAHRAPLKRVLPMPSQEEVSDSIKSWLWLCRNLRIEPGDMTNLSSVDWGQSFSHTNNQISQTAPVNTITFSNGTSIQSIKGTAFGFFASNALFTSYLAYMSREQWDGFKGHINRQWEDLAKDLEGTLVENAIIPKAWLAPYSATRASAVPELGTIAIKRIAVEWRDWPRNTHRTVSVDETKVALWAEFDVETGELVAISFRDPAFIAALRAAQLKLPQGSSRPP
jgi:hypothetical protein